MELKDYKDQVYALLRDFPDARNNDWTLIAHYVHKFRPELVHMTTPDQRLNESVVCVPLNKFKNFPSAETLIRARRIIQNDDGDFPPTDEKVFKARGIKQKNYQDAEVREATAHTVNPQYKHE